MRSSRGHFLPGWRRTGDPSDHAGLEVPTALAGTKGEIRPSTSAETPGRQALGIRTTPEIKGMPEN